MASDNQPEVRALTLALLQAAKGATAQQVAAAIREITLGNQAVLDALHELTEADARQDEVELAEELLNQAIAANGMTRAPLEALARVSRTRKVGVN